MSQFTDSYPSIVWSLQQGLAKLDTRRQNVSCTSHKCTNCPIKDAFPVYETRWCGCNGSLPQEDYHFVANKLKEDIPELLI